MYPGTNNVSEASHFLRDSKENLMFRLRILAFAVCVFAVTALAVRAQDDELKAILQKSIKAHGGADNLTKFKAGSSKMKGTMKVAGLEFDIVAETWLRKPNQFKKVMTLEVKGKSIDMVQVFNGESFWINTMGKTQEIKDDKVIKEIREALEAEGGGSFVEFMKKPYELSALGEMKIKGKDAVGIRVSKKGQRDISFYFDKKTHLVVKIETRGLDPTGQKEALQEKFIMSYQDKNGMKVGKHLVILMDGEPFMDVEITDVQALDKIDDAMFAKP